MTARLGKLLRQRLVDWLLKDTHVREQKFGDASITIDPAGVDVIRWSATQASVQAGDLAMNTTTGRPTCFVGGLDVPVEQALAVTSAAALTTAGTGQTDGCRAYVSSPLLRMYKLSRSDAQTPDGINVIAATGGGNWLAQPNITDSSWLAQTAWGINPTTGSDFNVGSVASPLRTWGEFARRMVANTTLTPIAVSMTVTIVGDLPSSDPIRGEFWLANGVEIDVSQTTTAVGVVSTFTSLLTKNRGTPQNWSPSDTNNAQLIAGNVGVLLNDTTNSSFSWIDSTAGGAQGGGGNVTLTEPMVPLVAANSATPAVVAIVNGDSYNLQRAGQAVLGNLRVHAMQALSQPSIRFYNFWFVNAGANSNLENVSIDGFGRIDFCQCKFEVKPQISLLNGNATVNFLNCLFTTNASGVAANGTGQVSILAGGAISAGGGHTIAGGILTIDADNVNRSTSNPSANPGGTLVFGNYCSYASQIASTVPLSGAGAGASAIRLKIGSYTTSVLWGVQSTRLFQLTSGSSVIWSGTLTNIIGPSTSLTQTLTTQFGSTTLTACPVWNPATQTWAAAPGAGTTITNLLATIGGGGYGGNAIDPLSGCRFAAL